MKEFQVIWRGVVHDASGYARAAREHVCSLVRAGIDVRIEPVNFGTAPAAFDPGQARELETLIAKPRRPDADLILIAHMLPDGIDLAIERARHTSVLCSTMWEATRFPRGLVDRCNLFDGVIVPSRQSYLAFKASGVTSPLFRVPFGAAANFFRPTDGRMEIPGYEGQFRFLSVFEWNHRKGPDILLRAFWSEFSSKEKVVLVLKTNLGRDCALRGQLALREHLKRVKRSLGFGDGRAPVLLNTSLLSDFEMQALYRTADVFVLPTRGEGVGLPFIEAMSTGLPVIATGWGGHMDFLTARNSWLVPYELRPANAPATTPIAPVYDGLLEEGMLLAECDIEALRATMRHVFQDRSALSTKSAIARNDMIKMTWAMSGRTLRRAIESTRADRGRGRGRLADRAQRR